MAADIVKTGTCLLGNCQVTSALSHAHESSKAAHIGKGSFAAAEPVVLTCSCNWQNV